MNNITLLEDERIDDLQYNDLHIIQNKNLYAFTCDAVLLANFVKANFRDNMVDLCSGSGIVGILSQAKTKCKSLTCVELQEKMAKMCEKSILLNNLESKVNVINCSVQDCVNILGKENYSIVVCNPPYKKVQSHKISEREEIGICKYEIKLTFKELAQSASNLLKFGGKFFFVHESCRLVEIFEDLKKVNLQPKRVCFVYPKKDANSHIMLVEAVKGGKDGLIVEKSITL